MTIGHSTGHVKRRLSARGLLGVAIRVAHEQQLALDVLVCPTKALIRIGAHRRARWVLWEELHSKHGMSTTEIGKLLARPQTTIASGIAMLANCSGGAIR